MYDVPTFFHSIYIHFVILNSAIQELLYYMYYIITRRPTVTQAQIRTVFIIFWIGAAFILLYYIIKEIYERTNLKWNMNAY